MPNVDRAAIARAFLPEGTEFISEEPMPSVDTERLAQIYGLGKTRPRVILWWFHPPPGYGFPWKLDLWDKAVDEVERISGNEPPDRKQRW